MVLGATGATGQELVKRLLNDSYFDKVSVFIRGILNIEHKKLVKHKIDFSRIKEYKPLVSGDILFSAFGTTKKDAGSKRNQYLIDYTYQYEFAKMASENGVTFYSLVSSAGANEKSPFFYPKIKGELEVSVKKLLFYKIQIFQPPILIRQPELIREGERIAINILKKFNKIGVLKSQKPLLVDDLAKKMVSEVKSNNTGRITTYKPNDLFRKD